VTKNLEKFNVLEGTKQALGWYPRNVHGPGKRSLSQAIKNERLATARWLAGR